MIFGEPRSYLKIEVVRPTMVARMKGWLANVWEFVVLWLLLTGLIYFLRR